MAALLLAGATGALLLLPGCEASSSRDDSTRAQLARLSSSVRRQVDEIRRLNEKIAGLERAMGRRSHGAAPRRSGLSGDDAAAGSGESAAEARGSDDRTAGGGTGPRPGPRRPDVRKPRPSGPRRVASDVPSTRRIQQALANAGFNPGPVDGKKGPRTTAAIKEFQRKNNLPVTGVVDPDTLMELQRHME